MNSSRDRIGYNETGCIVTHCDGTADFYPSGTSGTTAYDHAEKGGMSNSTNSGSSVSGSTYRDDRCYTASNGVILAPALLVQPKPGPSACSTNASVKSTLKGCYNGMNTLGLIPKGPPILKQRMLAGKMAKAKRGKIYSRLPAGYIRNKINGVAKEPDEQVQSVY